MYGGRNIVALEWTAAVEADKLTDWLLFGDNVTKSTWFSAVLTAHVDRVEWTGLNSGYGYVLLHSTVQTDIEIRSVKL